jgi:hypothetical protein
MADMDSFTINGFSFVRARGPDTRPAWCSDAAGILIVEDRCRYFSRIYTAKRHNHDVCRDGKVRKFVTPQDAAAAALV